MLSNANAMVPLKLIDNLFEMTDRRRRRRRRRPKVVPRAATDFVQKLKIEGTEEAGRQTKNFEGKEEAEGQTKNLEGTEEAEGQTKNLEGTEEAEGQTKNLQKWFLELPRTPSGS